jgi:hypothetical protein
MELKYYDLNPSESGPFASCVHALPTLHTVTREGLGEK